MWFSPPFATSLYGTLGISEAEIAGLKRQIPLGRRGAPGEIVHVPRFEEGAFEVGSEFVIDGGMRTYLAVTQDVLFVLERARAQRSAHRRGSPRPAR